MNAIEVLDRTMYTEAAAARFLGIAQGTLHYWLEGDKRGDKVYKPIIREEPSGARQVTWAEFIEAAMLREYRRTHRVPMAELRDFIEDLRQKFQVPYPLAHEQPLVSGRRLVYKVQMDNKLDGDLCLVAYASGQYLLTPASQAFYDRVQFDEEVAASWRPHSDPNSPVRCNPSVRFGKPAIEGISTAVLWEHDEAGESPDEIAKEFELSTEQVRWALAYENSTRAA